MFHGLALLLIGFALGDLGTSADENKAIEADVELRVATDVAHDLFDQSKWAEAEEAFGRVISLHPSTEGYFYRAGCRYRLRRYNDAVHDINCGLECVAKGDDGIHPAWFYVLLSHIRADLDDLPGAITEITSAIETLPEEEDFFLRRSKYYCDSGEYQLAIDDLSRVVELAPDNIKAYESRATLWGQLGEYSRAIDDLSQLLNERPEDVRLLGQRALCHLHLGHYAVAIADLEKALAIDPTDVGSRIVLARALVYREEDRLPDNVTRSIELMESVCESSSWGNVAHLQMSARVLSAAGEWERAIGILRQAIAVATAEQKTKLAPMLWKLQQRQCLVGNWDDIHLGAVGAGP